MDSILTRIATELVVHPQQIQATVELLDEGATVPFIARYRKERTGGLDDTQLRYLATRLESLRELEKRRETVLHSIREQGKLSIELEQQIQAAETRTRLEDLYLPYRPKRRTKAQLAREAGLAPLSEQLLANPRLDPEQQALRYLNAELDFVDSKSVLEGARHILMEKIAEQAELVGELRAYLWENGILTAQVIAGKEIEGEKFKDYFHYNELLKKIPSHRYLALLRGHNEGILNLNLDSLTTDAQQHPCEIRVAQALGIRDQGRAADQWLLESVRQAWKTKLKSRLELDLKNTHKEQAEQEAIRVFAANLKDLLLAAPAGSRVTMGLDPGLRTGVKVAIVDNTGQLLATDTIYPHVPRQQWEQSLAQLAAACRRYQVSLISIGNGTASRETDQLVAELIKRHPELNLTKLVVSEAGASVYSASELAAKEFPDLDVSLRGAVSIARRLQDPLAELVKIDPKSIGVGQYQHDVNQTALAQSLDAVIEDCVNAVGVDVNMASVPLLTRVSGLNATLAANIVAFRQANGRFRNREQLKKVARLGGKTFEQAAGFLRIQGGDNPLDASAVHPEAYRLVERMAVGSGLSSQALIGNASLVARLKPSDYVSSQFGLPTIRDILAELEKPGRDPRPQFVSAQFKDGVNTLEDLAVGMVLEGVVTNVANFGAFVDIGVHQDGLVHISRLSHQFIKDPREVVRTGDVVKVRVEEVDVARKRIALTMRLDQANSTASSVNSAKETKPALKTQASTVQPSIAVGSALAAAFARANKH